jgi:hypothetical protein
LRHSNSAWVDVVDTYDKDGLCKPAAIFKIQQQCQLLCQAYIFALDWMNQQSDYPPKPQNKTKRDSAAKLSVPGHVLDPTKFRSEKLQETAYAQDIPLTKIVPNVEGAWVGK